jgi:hypothetical protein
VIAAITVALIEITTRVGVRFGLFHSHDRLTEPNTSFYRDENPAFGVWHPPNMSFHAYGACYDVIYRSNSYGARDRERPLHSDVPRVVVLGDSMVEGYGVEQEKRMTDILERRTGVEYMNFATGGNFSSIQEWLLYETLASRFDHQRVLLFIFPNNDFIENDPKRFISDRYRPYLRRVGDSFEVYYPTDLETAKRRDAEQLWWNRWYNAFYVYRVAYFVDAQIRMRIAEGWPGRYGYVAYQQFDDEDLARLLFSYRKIRDDAGGRQLVIFTIPRLNELLYAEGEGSPDRLPSALRAFARTEPRVEYFDLLPGFLEDRRIHGRQLSDYFLPCDPHWSELGNAVAADLVLKALDERETSEVGATRRALVDR